MTAERELQDWLADRARQRRTRRAMDDYARDWNRGPVHQRFDRAIAALPAQTAEAVADAVRALFADDFWVETLLDSLAERLRGDPFFEPPFRPINSDIHSGLLVFEDERVSIAAAVTRVARLAAKKNAKRGPTSVNFTGQVGVLKFVRAGGARLSFWEAPEITADFTAAAAGQCRRTGERALADGEVLVIDGRRQSFVIERARANIVLLQASITLDQAPVTVEYDSATGAYVGCSATGDSASRIQTLTTLLRKLDCDGAFPAIAAFLDHADFFVRWHVMKELLGIDAAAALPHLKRMAARDSHPDTRRAARSVLDRLEAPAPSKAA
jgi:HEAT repeats